MNTAMRHASRVVRRACSATAVLVVLTTSANAQGGQPEFRVQRGVTVQRDTVRIGDPFDVVVRIVAPKGATIQFPDAPDSTQKVQGLDPPIVTSGADTATLEQTARYRVAAWDIDQQPIVLGDVTVRYGVDERVIPLGPLAVYVQSVLPADSAQRVPKPARALMTRTFIPWWVWALIAAAVALGLWLWWWWTHRKRRGVVAEIIDPYQRAQQEFTRVEALGLLDAGERGRYVALMVEVLRGYLADRFPDVSLAHTTTELLSAARTHPTVAHDRLMRVLNEADLVKFARRPVSVDRARDLGRDARAIVERDHEANRPVAEAAA